MNYELNDVLKLLLYLYLVTCYFHIHVHVLLSLSSSGIIVIHVCGGGSAHRDITIENTLNTHYFCLCFLAGGALPTSLMITSYKQHLSSSLSKGTIFKPSTHLIELAV